VLGLDDTDSFPGVGTFTPPAPGRVVGVEPAAGVDEPTTGAGAVSDDPRVPPRSVFGLDHTGPFPRVDAFIPPVFGRPVGAGAVPAVGESCPGECAVTVDAGELFAPLFIGTLRRGPPSATRGGIKPVCGFVDVLGAPLPDVRLAAPPLLEPLPAMTSGCPCPVGMLGRMVLIVPSCAISSCRVAGTPVPPRGPRPSWMLTCLIVPPPAEVMRVGEMPLLMIVLLFPRMMLFTTVVWP